MSLVVTVKRLHPDATMPAYAHPGDAGLNLTATSVGVDEYGCRTYGTGLAFAIPDGHVGLLFPRSSIFKKDLAMANAVGVIDAKYRGEVMLKMRPIKRASGREEYAVGDRVGQLVIVPIPRVELVEVGELAETARGEGGFGSTGK